MADGLPITMTTVRRLLGLLSASVLTACATMANTPAQDLAWERWQKCNHFRLITLKEIKTDGQIWVWVGDGGEQTAWRECDRKAREEQGRGVAAVSRPQPSGLAQPPPSPAAESRQDSRVAERPIVSVGDEWLRSDGALRVIASDGSGYVLEVGPKRYKVTRDGALYEVAINGVPVVRYSPPFPLFAWPLRVGRSWTYQGHLSNRLTGFDGAVQESLRVEAFEEIVVRAGAVKAFRIEATTSTYWYSPEVRTIVRRIAKRRQDPLLEEFELASLPTSAMTTRVPLPDSASRPGGDVTATTQGPALRPREIARRALPSVVLVVCGDANGKASGFGSAFFVRDDLVVTNFHVIEGAIRAVAKLYGQDKVHEVSGVVAADRGRDLAVLRVQGVKGTPLQLAPPGSVSIGDEIYVAGNPEGLEGTFAPGVISGIRQDSAVRLLQITAPVSPGSSGSPVLNADGAVIGVVIGTWRQGQSLNFAVDVSEVRLLLGKVGPMRPLPLKD